MSEDTGGTILMQILNFLIRRGVKTFTNVLNLYMVNRQYGTALLDVLNLC